MILFTYLVWESDESHEPLHQKYSRKHEFACNVYNVLYWHLIASHTDELHKTLFNFKVNNLKKLV